jgi:hypothetical protein
MGGGAAAAPALRGIAAKAAGAGRKVLNILGVGPGLTPMQRVSRGLTNIGIFLGGRALVKGELPSVKETRIAAGYGVSPLGGATATVETALPWLYRKASEAVASQKEKFGPFSSPDENITRINELIYGVKKIPTPSFPGMPEIPQLPASPSVIVTSPGASMGMPSISFSGGGGGFDPALLLLLLGGAGALGYGLGRRRRKKKYKKRKRR